MPTNLERSMAALRDAALAYPDAYEELPWGHSAIKVRTRAFVFFYLDDNRLSLSSKLPRSSDVALLLPFATPTGYGLGRSGWVTAAFGPRDEVPLDILRRWIDESYRAIAPAKLTKNLTPPADAAPTRTPSARPADAGETASKSSARKPASKPAVRKPSASKPPASKSPARTPAARTPSSASKPAARKPAARPPAANPASRVPAPRTPASKPPARTARRPR